jgi:hypothetical protein
VNSGRSLAEIMNILDKQRDVQKYWTDTVLQAPVNAYDESTDEDAGEEDNLNINNFSRQPTAVTGRNAQVLFIRRKLRTSKERTKYHIWVKRLRLLSDHL